MLTLSKEISINPSNYVELRGRERAHALIDELFGKPVNRGANPLEGEVSVRIATPAMSSFSSLRVSTGNRRFRELTFSSESISSTETIPARVATYRVLAAASAACSRLPMAASSK